MKRLWMLACLLLLSAGCAGNTLTPDRRDHTRWLEVLTPHFVLHTDLHEPAARDIARSLEEMRAALLQLAWTGAREPPRGKLDVVVFRNPGDFNRYVAGGRRLAGVAFARTDERRLLSFHPGQESGIPRVIIHELAHAISAWFMPIQPSWFAEGLAEFLENTTIDRGTGVAVMGNPSKRHQEWLSHAREVLRSEQLFAAYEPPHDGPYVGSYFYSSSWLLVHYLINREGERFAEFQRRLARLQGWRSAWGAAFSGISNEQLDQRVVAYAAKARFATLSGRLQLPAYEPQVRLLSAAEAHGARAQVARLVPALARQEAEAALRLDPNELGALRVTFGALDLQASEQRLALAERAVAAHPRRAEAWWLLALARGDGSAQTTALERAYQLDPDHPGVALDRARMLLQRGNPRAALPLTRLAVRSSAASNKSLSLHLQALVGTRDCERALLVLGNWEQLLSHACGPDQSCTESSRRALSDLVQPCVSGPSASDEQAAARLWGGHAPGATKAAPPPCTKPPPIDPKKPVTGRLAPEVIRSVVRASYGELRLCYEGALGRNRGARGRVILRFAIARDGTVSNVADGGSTLPDGEAVECIRSVFRRLRFPCPDGGIVTVSYPVMLEPGAGADPELSH